MRGKGGVNVKFSAQLRITPAYAGKRITCTLMLSLPQDHPRLCGEKFIFAHMHFVYSRITPAYAGKSFEWGGYVERV